MEDNNTSNVGRKIVKSIFRPILIISVIILIAIILIAVFVKELDIIDVREDADNPKNAPSAASSYMSSATIDKDGKVSFSMSIQEFWDKLKKDGNKVCDKLDSPEELAKLIRAQLVTQYVDTRENPDEEIDWDKINKDVNLKDVQGIIKLKRADENGNENSTTLKYVDEGTFYGWIEDYNLYGTKSSRDKVLSHFTLGESTDTSSGNISFSASDVVTEISEKIVKAANEQPAAGNGCCQAWVCRVYKRAGYGDHSYGSAYEAYEACKVSDSMENIPVGATVYATGTGSSGARYGHVGIYIGDGKVRDNWGPSIRECTLQEWINSQQENTYKGKKGWLGWGWQPNLPKVKGSSGSTNKASQNPSTQSSESQGKESEQKQQVRHYAVIGTWNETTTTVQSNDPNVPSSSSANYNISTTNIYYQDMVSQYAMPFNYLWAMLVYSQDKDFVLDLADLVYNSKFEITIYDKLTEVTTTETQNYKDQTDISEKIDVTVQIDEQMTYGGETRTNKVYHATYTDTEELTRKVPRTVVTTTIDKSHTAEIALTLADAWCVKYSQEYKYKTKEVTGGYNTGVQALENIQGDTTKDNEDAIPASNVALQKARNQYPGDQYGFYVSGIETTYKHSTVERTNQTVMVEKTATYVSSPAKTEEKTDKNADKPNFVTILAKNYNARSNIFSIEEWLFEGLEQNENTKNLLDLTKYLLYKVSGHSYGLTEYDFSVFEPSDFNTIGGGYYGDTLQERVWFALRNAGFSEFATAGAMGNIHYESGGFNPSAVENGGSGEGIGLIQWSWERRKQIEKYAASRGTKVLGNEELQIEFLLAELGAGGPAESFANVRQRGAIVNEGIVAHRKDWVNASNIEDATRAFLRYFESPQNGTSYPDRLKKAQEYYNQFHGKTLMAGGILQAAYKVHQDEITWTYSVSSKGSKTLYWNNIENSLNNPNKVTCCATYVNCVLYVAGYVSERQVNSFNYNSATATYNYFKGRGWQEITKYNQLEAGDVVFMTDNSGDSEIGHVQLYAGNGTWYNAGNTKSIQRQSPYKSNASGRFIKALRPKPLK